MLAIDDREAQELAASGNPIVMTLTGQAVDTGGTIFHTAVTFDASRDVMPMAQVYPDATAYGAALDAIAPTVTDKIDQTQVAGETWMDTLQRILPTLATTYQQSQLLQIQVDRAKAGLPPLDTSQYGVGVSVGINPGTQKLLMWGGGALAALLAINLLKGRK